MKTRIISILLLSIFFLGCDDHKTYINQNMNNSKNWNQELEDILPLLGHRNWILVVDKAFPLQSAEGMKYINTGAPFFEVLDTTIACIKKASHVKAILYTDAELNYLTDGLVPGISDFRTGLSKSLEGSNVQTLMHNDIFSRLDEASKLFNVVVIKTESVMPYTSVFIELDCGYWTTENETKLRELMNQ